jgi:cytochrome oxidase assembly protein ShyY1
LSKKREELSLLKSLVALLLIFLCIWAAQWQFNRGLDRQARNDAIEENTARPAQPLAALASDIAAHEWQTTTITGTFDTTQQILLRNRSLKASTVSNFLLVLRALTERVSG